MRLLDGEMSDDHCKKYVTTSGQSSNTPLYLHFDTPGDITSFVISMVSHYSPYFNQFQEFQLLGVLVVNHSSYHSGSL